MPANPPRRPARDRVPPVQVEFHRTKYGRELLVDAAWVSSMPTFLRDDTAHTLSFHDILVVTHGRGRFWLDGVAHRVRRGAVFFTLPGQVRQWEATGLEGACLFFTAEFVEDFFREERFLRDLAYFRAGRPSPELTLAPTALRTTLRRFGVMTEEVRSRRVGSEHLLRAILYELLVGLDRVYINQWGPPPAGIVHPQVDRFLILVERRFRREHRLAPYARDLGITPGHLRHLCRKHLGLPAAAVVRRRIAVEARRLLRHTQMTIQQVGATLGFTDPAYFSRFVRRETGRPPSTFRDTGL